MKMSLGDIAEKIQLKLDPEILEVLDESELHKGHQYYKQDMITHIKIRIKLKADNGGAAATLIAIHRSIYQVLSLELTLGLHAISIEVI